MSVKSSISASIVLYNNDFKIIQKAINSYLKIEQNTILYIIDNSPKNEFEKLISDHRIKYANYPLNIGFGAAHNVAIQKSIEENTTYHLILNPDVYFDPGIIQKIINFMDKNEDVGLIMPQIKYPNGQIQHLCKLLPSPLDLIGRRFIPIKKYIKKRNQKYELHFTEYNKIIDVPYLSGCFMFIRTSVLKKIGGFDERFFMYCEDVDLSRRIGQIAKTVFYPEVEVIHNYEKGSYKNLKLLKYHILSAIKYFNKWGWIFDNERKKINKRTLFNLGYFNMNKN